MKFAKVMPKRDDQTNSYLSRNAELISFMWGTAEGIFFFVVPDVFLSFIALNLTRRKLFRANIAALLGACFGGIIVYYATRLNLIESSIFHYVPFVDNKIIDESDKLWEQFGIWGVVVAPLRAVPYKLMAYQLGVHNVNLFIVILITFIGRSYRFISVTVVTYICTELIRKIRLAYAHYSRYVLWAYVWILVYVSIALDYFGIIPKLP